MDSTQLDLARWSVQAADQLEDERVRRAAIHYLVSQNNSLVQELERFLARLEEGERWINPLNT